MSSVYAKDQAVRRAVPGEAHMDGAEATKSAFDAPFQTLIMEKCVGHGLDR